MSPQTLARVLPGGRLAPGCLCAELAGGRVVGRGRGRGVKWFVSPYRLLSKHTNFAQDLSSKQRQRTISFWCINLNNYTELLENMPPIYLFIYERVVFGGNNPEAAVRFSHKITISWCVSCHLSSGGVAIVWCGDENCWEYVKVRWRGEHHLPAQCSCCRAVDTRSLHCSYSFQGGEVIISGSGGSSGVHGHASLCKWKSCLCMEKKIYIDTCVQTTTTTNGREIENPWRRIPLVKAVQNKSHKSATLHGTSAYTT